MYLRLLLLFREDQGITNFLRETWSHFCNSAAATGATTVHQTRLIWAYYQGHLNSPRNTFSSCPLYVFLLSLSWPSCCAGAVRKLGGFHIKQPSTREEFHFQSFSETCLICGLSCAQRSFMVQEIPRRLPKPAILQHGRAPDEFFTHGASLKNPATEVSFLFVLPNLIIWTIIYSND